MTRHERIELLDEVRAMVCGSLRNLADDLAQKGRHQLLVSDLAALANKIDGWLEELEER